MILQICLGTNARILAIFECEKNQQALAYYLERKNNLNCALKKIITL